MTAAMECGDSRRGGLNTGLGEWRATTTTLLAASAYRAWGAVGVVARSHCTAAAPTVVSDGGRQGRGVATAAGGLRRLGPQG